MERVKTLPLSERVRLAAFLEELRAKSATAKRFPLLVPVRTRWGSFALACPSVARLRALKDAFTEPDPTDLRLITALLERWEGAE